MVSCVVKEARMDACAHARACVRACEFRRYVGMRTSARATLPFQCDTAPSASSCDRPDFPVATKQTNSRLRTREDCKYSTGNSLSLSLSLSDVYWLTPVSSCCSRQTQGVVGAALNRQRELRVRCTASASGSSAEAASSVLSTSPESWIARVGRANSSTRHSLSHTHTHARLHTHRHTHASARTHAHTHTRTYTHTRAHTRTHPRSLTHTNTHAHTHTPDP